MYISATIAQRSRLALFTLHTFAVYFTAVELCPWAVGKWFAWVIPVLHVTTSSTAADWYLQHLEIVTIVVATVFGFLTTRQSFWGADWGWSVATIVLVYKMVTLNIPRSVLGDVSSSALTYFFEIQRVMPTLTNPFASDPARVLAQMTVTAPFYAGVAYSLGALVAKHKVLERIYGAATTLG